MARRSKRSTQTSIASTRSDRHADLDALMAQIYELSESRNELGDEVSKKHDEAAKLMEAKKLTLYRDIDHVPPLDIDLQRGKAKVHVRKVKPPKEFPRD